MMKFHLPYLFYVINECHYPLALAILSDQYLSKVAKFNLKIW